MATWKITLVTSAISVTSVLTTPLHVLREPSSIPASVMQLVSLHSPRSQLSRSHEACGMGAGQTLNVGVSGGFSGVFSFSLGVGK
jgi:hypothetical protein